MKPKHFIQKTNYTCGPACIRMVLSKWGIEVSEEELVKQMHTNDKEGTKPEEMVSIASKFGLKVFTKQHATLEELDKLLREGWMVIVAYSVDVPHYAVYAGSNEQHIFLNDPFFGERFAFLKKKFMNKWLINFKQCSHKSIREIIAYKLEEETSMTLLDLIQILKKITFDPSNVDMGWDWRAREVFKQTGEVDGYLFQCSFRRPELRSGLMGTGYGREWYVGVNATEDSIVKTAWCAVNMIVTHEMMENFKWAGIRVFDPHKTLNELSYFNRFEKKDVKFSKGENMQCIYEKANDVNHVEASLTPGRFYIANEDSHFVNNEYEKVFVTDDNGNSNEFPVGYFIKIR